jgi:hypothetical protein
VRVSLVFSSFAQLFPPSPLSLPASPHSSLARLRYLLLTFQRWTILASLIFAVCIPVVLALLAICATGVSFLFHKIKNSPNLELSYFKTRAAKVFAITLSLGYFSIVVNVVQMLGCTGENSLTGKHFLNVYLSQNKKTKK